MSRLLIAVPVFIFALVVCVAVTFTGLRYAAETVIKIAGTRPMAVSVKLRTSYLAPLPRAKVEGPEAKALVPATSDAIRGPAAPGVIPAPSVSVEPRTYSHQVSTGALRVRSGPSKTSSELFQLKSGMRVNLGEGQNGWVRVTAEDGRSGWVFPKYLEQISGFGARSTLLAAD